MAIKVDKRTLKLGNDLELYVSEIINKKAGFDKSNEPKTRYKVGCVFLMVVVSILPHARIRTKWPSATHLIFINIKTNVENISCEFGSKK